MKRLVAISLAVLATATLAVEWSDARPCFADRSCDGSGLRWATSSDGDGWGHRWMRGEGASFQHRWAYRWRNEEGNGPSERPGNGSGFRGGTGDGPPSTPGDEMDQGPRQAGGREFIDEDGDGICDLRDTDGWQGRGSGRTHGR